MKPNVGKADKIVRYTVGILAIAAGVYYQNWLGALGIVPIFTAIIGWCPLYAPSGISTVEKKTQTNN